MMKYSISIPIGAWNDFLPYTLESLKAQKADLSIALLDASGDSRVAALADAYSEMLSYRRHGPDKGQSDAIIEGWNNTDGNILGWLNADDSLFPTALELATSKFEEDPELEIVCGQSTILDESDRMTGYHFNVKPVDETLLQGCTITQPSCFFRRSAYEAVGGLKRDLHYTMDWELWLRLYSNQAKFGFIDSAMSRVLWASDTKSASFNGRRRYELQELIKMYCPADLQKQTLKAFAFHAGADMLWPKALRNRATRFLRRAGPVVYGIRADGRVENHAVLNMLHYQAGRASGLILNFVGDVKNLKFDVPNLSSVRVLRRNKVALDFDEPVIGAKVIDVAIQSEPRGTSGDAYFQSAEWVFDHCP